MKYLFIILLLIQSCQLVKYTKKSKLKDNNKQSQVKNSDSAKSIIKKTNEKVTLAIIDFDIRGSNISNDEMLTLTDRINYSFVKSKNYNVLTRSQIKAILYEQNFSLGTDCDNSCAVEVGRFLSAKKIVKGAIGKVGNKYSIIVYMIDVTTGKIDKIEKKDYEGDKDGLLKIIDKIGEKLSI